MVQTLIIFETKTAASAVQMIHYMRDAGPSYVSEMVSVFGRGRKELHAGAEV